MRVTIVPFASARDAVGASETVVELGDGCEIEALRRELTARYPSLADQWERIAIAVDGELVTDDVTLRDGQEVALLPPVSGG